MTHPTTNVRVSHQITSDNVMQRGRNRETHSHWEYSDKISGADALVVAAREIKQGKAVVFAAARRDEGFPARVVQIISFGLGDVDGKPALRMIEGAANPNDAGSSSLIASYYRYADSIPHMAATMGLCLVRLGGGLFFRLA